MVEDKEIVIDAEEVSLSLIIDDPSFIETLKPLAERFSKVRKMEIYDEKYVLENIVSLLIDASVFNDYLDCLRFSEDKEAEIKYISLTPFFDVIQREIDDLEEGFEDLDMEDPPKDISDFGIIAHLLTEIFSSEDHVKVIKEFSPLVLFLETIGKPIDTTVKCIGDSFIIKVIYNT